MGLGGVFILSRHFERKRREDLRLFAERRGFSFIAHPTPIEIRNAEGFELLSRGYNRSYMNLVRGRIGGFDLALFDFHYVTGSGRHRNNRKLTVVMFLNPRLALPHFQLRPENVLDKFLGKIGFEDIDFDSHPHFSESYALRGKDKEQIKSLFNERLLSYFSVHKGLEAEGTGDTLIFFKSSKLLGSEELDRFLAESYSAAEVFL